MELDRSTAAAVPKPATTSAATAMRGALRQGLATVRLPRRMPEGSVVVAVISFSSRVVDRLNF
jgi:hypothetical protein